VKKPGGRRQPVKSHTPVIAGRVPETLHRQIKEAARKSGRTMSDELAWRAAMSFQWEAALGEFEQAKKALARMTHDAATAELERLGWPSVVDPKYGGPIFFPPDRFPNFPKSSWVDPKDDPEFMKKLAQAVKAELLKKEGEQ
jgi:hypothetical protein